MRGEAARIETGGGAAAFDHRIDALRRERAGAEIQGVLDEAKAGSLDAARSSFQPARACSSTFKARSPGRRQNGDTVARPGSEKMARKGDPKPIYPTRLGGA